MVFEERKESVRSEEEEGIVERLQSENTQLGKTPY